MKTFEVFANNYSIVCQGETIAKAIKASLISEDEIRCIVDTDYFNNYIDKQFYDIAYKTWKQCHICNGTGWTYSPNREEEFMNCPICNGQKIINIKTGKPPQ